MSRREATLAACQLRLRPIVMTSFAFILGVVPLVVVEGRRRRDAADAGHGRLQRHARRDAVRHLPDAGVLLRHRLAGRAVAVQHAGGRLVGRSLDVLTFAWSALGQLRGCGSAGERADAWPRAAETRRPMATASETGRRRRRRTARRRRRQASGDSDRRRPPVHAPRGDVRTLYVPTAVPSGIRSAARDASVRLGSTQSVEPVMGDRHVLALLHRPADLRLGAVDHHHPGRRHRRCSRCRSRSTRRSRRRPSRCRPSTPAPTPRSSPTPWPRRSSSRSTASRT